MGGRARLAAIAATLAFGAAISPATLADDPPKEFMPGELLIKIKQGYDGPGAEAIEKIGAVVQEKLSRIDVSRLKLPKGMTVQQGLEKLSKLPFFEYVEPNRIFKPTWSPSDPRYSEQWGLDAIEIKRGWGLETGNRKTIIAIVDTGVQLNHPDLKNKIVKGYDFVDGDDNPEDDGGHGTHCAGIAAASTNNGVGVAGVCPNCSIMPVRVLSPWGGSASDVAQGIVWAVDHGAQVISMSLGGEWPSSTQEDAIEYAWQKGAILIAAAGNMNTSQPHYPAYHSKCLAVGSTEQGDSRSDFSNYGDWVDVAAPGGWIMSTVPGSGYEYKSGTSMACPAVAGLAGLLFSRPGMTNAAVRAAIEDTADPIGGWVSRGRVNVPAALARANPKAPSGGGSGGSTGGGSGGSTGGGSGGSTGGGSGGSTGGGSGGSTGGGDGGFSPKGFAVSRGSTLKSPQNSLVYSDDQQLVLRSTQSGNQRYLDFYVKTNVSYKGTLKSIKIVLEGLFFDGDAEVKAYLWNWHNEQWDWVGQETLGLTEREVKFSRKSPAAYVAADGEVRVRFYRETKWYATFDFAADRVRFYPKAKAGSASPPPVEQTPPPPTPDPGQTDPGKEPDDGEDKSLGEKAKDAWDKWKTGW